MDGARVRDDVAPDRRLWIVFAFLLVVGLSRSPDAFLHGRFFAEEGTLYFPHMVTHATPGNLTYVQPKVGYFYLFAAVATWCAAQESLLHAPLVTTWSSFGIVAAIVGVVLRWPSELFPTVGARVVAATLFVAGTLALPQIWASTTDSQSYLAILALLLLFVETERLRRYQFVAGGVLLVVAGLSGLYACALVPCFAATAWTDRSRRRILYAGLIAAASVCQLGVLVWSKASGNLSQARSGLPSIGTVVRGVSAFHVVGLFSGSSLAARVNRRAAGTGGLVLMTSPRSRSSW